MKAAQVLFWVAAAIIVLMLGLFGIIGIVLAPPPIPGNPVHGRRIVQAATETVRRSASE